MDLFTLASPDTAAAVAANQVARRYCSSALYSHSVRIYLWGVAYAVRDGVEFDRELLYVAAMLHDIGLTRPFDPDLMPFEEAGGQAAWVFGAAAGWSDERRTRVTQVIGSHLRPATGLPGDVEGFLLATATDMDLCGRGLEVVPVELQADVANAWPRFGMEATECLRMRGDGLGPGGLLTPARPYR